MSPRPPQFLSFLAAKRLSVAVVLLVALALGLAGFAFTRVNEQDHVLARFEQRVDIRQANLSNTLRLYENLLFSLHLLFEFSEEVTPTEFREAAHSLYTRLPGIQALQWVPLLPPDQRPAAEEVLAQHFQHHTGLTARDEHNQLIPSPPRDSYWPILYTYPVTGNRAALGYNLEQGPTRHALLRAATTDRIVFTNKITLLQSGHGLVMMHAIRHHLGQETPQLVGYVQIVFSLTPMLDTLWHEPSSAIIDVAVMDITDPTPVHLYSRHSGQPGTSEGHLLPPAFENPLVLKRSFLVGDRHWQVHFLPAPDWLAAQFTLAPHFIGLFLFSLGAGLAGYLTLLRSRNADIADQVHDRTAELRQVQRQLEEDIEKRRKTESDLRESRRQLESLLGQLAGMAYQFAVLPQGEKALYISHGLEEISGCTTAQFMRTNGHALRDLIPPSDYATARKTVKAALARHDDYEVEYRLTATDGRQHYILDRGSGVYDHDGTLLFREGLAIDITRLREAEEEKILLERRLLESQKLESLGVLAGGIAHDFNNLLTGIIGNSGLVRMQLSPRSEAHQLLGEVEKGALRAAELCQLMLAFSGRGRFSVQPLNLCDLVRDLLPLLNHSIHRLATLHLSLQQDLPDVMVDAAQIRQVTMNLIINAAESLNQQAGDIYLTLGRQQADPSFLQHCFTAPDLKPGEFIFFEVRDTGCGMTPDTLKRIFEPFFTTKFTGRGLGLPAVLGIIRGHSGALRVQSQPGQGTTFRLLLPPSPLKAETSTVSTPPFPLEPISRHLLLVDDDDTVREVASHLLRTLGMRTTPAASGREAIELYQANPDTFDGIILDCTMPDIHGTEIYHQLRQTNPRLPILLMSGYNEREVATPINQDEFALFLQKPFGLEELLRKLRRLGLTQSSP